MSLQIRIITPDRVVWKTEADELILPTSTGLMGVLKDHISSLTALEIGLLKVKQKNKWTPIALMGGFALVEKNTITILVNDAKKGEEINLQEAEQLLEKTKNELEIAESLKDQIEAKLAYKRAEICLKAAQEV
uniref:ATP synthase epsilon chain, chloroplastic n=1 Tax=Verdigellas peltata TaxID=542676 RepID=A0A161KKB8_9VIRI|nr:ATP synthase CF1 epsilon subunit [Verdigellas peltata]CZF96705.1 ATP synthase CF1 epsilon subunit [Verdigellas peltata]